MEDPVLRSPAAHPTLNKLNLGSPAEGDEKLYFQATLPLSPRACKQGPAQCAKQARKKAPGSIIQDLLLKETV